MQPQPPDLSRESFGAAETVIFGDGTGPGLIIRQSLLEQICGGIRGQMDGTGGGLPSNGHLGLLLGPAPQGGDLAVEDVVQFIRNPEQSESRGWRIPLVDYVRQRFAPRSEILLADIESVRPVVEEAWEERSHAVLGWYRILRPSDDSVSKSGFEFLASKGQNHFSLFNVRCHLELVCVSASETSLRVYMRNGEHWKQIQEVTLQRAAPGAGAQALTGISKSAAPGCVARWLDEEPAAPGAGGWAVTGISNPAAPPGDNASLTVESLHRRGRLWFDVTVITLLVLSIAMNTLMVRVLRRVQREKVNLAALLDQVRESTVRESTAAAPVPPEAALAPSAAAPGNSQLAASDLPPNSGPSAPRAGALAIAKKPAILKRSEVFQFNGNGDPAPEVVWSSEGPGSIDPIYGLYRAPDKFAGETKVKIIARSWMGSQAVTFTLKGEPKSIP